MINAKKKKLIERREKIQAQLDAITARERTEIRKLDTRRKILLGSYLLKVTKMTADEIASLKLDAFCGKIFTAQKTIDEFLSRRSDRQLFGLMCDDNDSDDS